MTPIAYGIDFGTTNSVLAVAYPDRTEVMSDLGLSLLRSVVYLDAGGARTAGEQALRQFLANPQVDEARVILDLKASLTDEHLDETYIFGRNYSLEELASLIFGYLKLLGDRATGSDTRRAVIGFPVAFPGAKGARFETRQNLALERLCTAAELAGFSQVEPLEEPAAAATGEAASVYVATDFGGGTFDVAVVEVDGELEHVRSLTGVAVGGEQLTAELFAMTAEPMLGLDADRLPARYRQAVRSLPGLLRALFERDLDPAVFREAAPEFQRVREAGFLFDLYQSVEQAKRDLSDDEEAVLRLSRRGFEHLSTSVKRRDFEERIHPCIDRIVAQIEAGLERSGCARSDVELVTLTGGSSRIPLYRAAVHDMFPQAAVEDRDPYGRVALGLADYARSVPW